MRERREERLQTGWGKARWWTGWVLTALLALLLLSSGINLARHAEFVLVHQRILGYSDDLATGIGITACLCGLLLLIPRTAVFSAILATGYLGGATASHLRVGEPFFPPVVLGFAMWAALYLREPRLGALLSPRSFPEKQ